MIHGFESILIFMKHRLKKSKVLGLKHGVLVLNLTKTI